MQKPHKGQEFSVDDAEDEVEVDQVLHRHAKLSTGTLRRQPSTLRRRITPGLPRVDSEADEELEDQNAGAQSEAEIQNIAGPAEEVVLTGEPEEETPDEDDADLSDAESFTLKDRQEAINETHPFGIRIWKPALYKKSRSVQKTAEEEIHSTPGGNVSNWLLLFNFLWTILFGLWLAIFAGAGAFVCLLFSCFGGGCVEYGKTLWGLSGYFLYPFGKYVKLLQEEAYADEDEGEGRSISEYEQWQSGDIEEGRLFFGPININRSLIGRRRNSVDSADETDSLLGRTGRDSGDAPESRHKRRRLFGRGEWNLGRVIFFVFFYGLITPFLFLVSGICWLLVFTIPMGKVTLLLFYHLRRHPLALSFHNDSHITRAPDAPSAAILLCTYRAVGLRYWKYTIDGTNIFLINLLSLVAFVIFDYWVLREWLGIKTALTSPGLVFMLALFSIIPLAYFIGQAVASISAQSSMGVGATVNAFFSTVVEVYLYCVALNEGKAQLVEGSVIGSIHAGILFLPGISMCFGALRRKTQRFNVKSAGVTSTMLLFAVIGAFGPTLFYQIYGSHELNCSQCVVEPGPSQDVRDCRRCYFAQTPAINDRFYQKAVRPFSYIAAFLLFLSYVIGLLFTLRTHAAVIWSSEIDEKKAEKMDASGHLSQSAGLSTSLESSHITFQNTGSTLPRNPNLSRSDIRESQLYKRILGQSLKQVGLNPQGVEFTAEDRKAAGDIPENQIPHVVPPRGREEDSRPGSRSQTGLRLFTLSEEENQSLVMQVAEMAATAATVAARDATRTPHKASRMAVTPVKPSTTDHPPLHRTTTNVEDEDIAMSGEAHHTAGGHDAPNWSRTKSTVILLTATVAYAIIAEILVKTVDSVLEHVDIDEKFLGITLFALVPNTTEFLVSVSSTQIRVQHH